MEIERSRNLERLEYIVNQPTWQSLPLRNGRSYSTDCCWLVAKTWNVPAILNTHTHIKKGERERPKITRQDLVPLPYVDVDRGRRWRDRQWKRGNKRSVPSVTETNVNSTCLNDWARVSIAIVPVNKCVWVCVCVCVFGEPCWRLGVYHHIY